MEQGGRESKGRNGKENHREVRERGVERWSGKRQEKEDSERKRGIDER